VIEANYEKRQLCIHSEDTAARCIFTENLFAEEVFETIIFFHRTKF